MMHILVIFVRYDFKHNTKYFNIKRHFAIVMNNFIKTYLLKENYKGEDGLFLQMAMTPSTDSI